MLRRMSPQRSNRDALLEGALHCLEKTPSAKITARQIAAAADANLRSIGYHFGSTDTLLAEAMAMAFSRWLDELTSDMGDLSALNAVQRIQRATDILVADAKARSGLLHAYLSAIASAPHSTKLRIVLRKRFDESCTRVAVLLDLGDDEDGMSAASLVLANFNGLLVQTVLDPDDATDLQRGIQRLISVAQSQD
jgi:AcrR family transcriptional regulator